MATTTQDWIEELKGISVLELRERIKALEETFGVSATAVAAAAPAGGGGGGDAAAEEEAPTTVDVVLTARRRQEDPGHQGRPRGDRPRSQGGQGARRRGAQGDPRGRRARRGREAQDRARGGRRSVELRARHRPPRARTGGRPASARRAPHGAPVVVRGRAGARPRVARSPGLHDEVLAHESPQRLALEEQRQQALLDLAAEAAGLLEHGVGRRRLAVERLEAPAPLGSSMSAEHSGRRRRACAPRRRPRRARGRRAATRSVGGSARACSRNARPRRDEVVAGQDGQRAPGEEIVRDVRSLAWRSAHLSRALPRLALEVDADRPPVAHDVVEEEPRRPAVAPLALEVGGRGSRAERRGARARPAAGTPRAGAAGAGSCSCCRRRRGRSGRDPPPRPRGRRCPGVPAGGPQRAARGRRPRAARPRPAPGGGRPASPRRCRS